MSQVNKTERVRQLLIKYPELRKNDKYFVTAYWRLEEPILCKFSTAENFLKAYASGELTPDDTLVRLKRRVQEKHTDLQ